MKKYGLIIDGNSIITEKTQSVYDKYSSEEIAQVAVADKEHISLAVEAALNTFKNDKLTPYERYDILHNAAHILKDKKEEIAKVLVAEIGKPINDSRVEVDRAVQTLLLSAEEAKRIGGELIPFSASPGSENKMGYYMRVPIGVVCAITPFNVPLNLSCHKIGPAIATGNTVVWKSASNTPLSAYYLMDALTEAGLPDGYVNLINGPGSTVGNWLLEDQRIGKYTFTGSPAIGLHVKEKSGFRRVSLELGNNSPNIVHHDADIDLAAKMCVKWGFTNAGQACISAQRIYVHEKIEKEFKEKLLDYTKQLVVGNPLKEETSLGPLISQSEADRVYKWIEEAKTLGATVLIGGDQNGSFITPTVLERVNEDMKVVCEEVFGPVISLLTYKTIDEAIEAANDSDYGLQSGIFTTNINTAMSVVKRLNTGGVIVNDASTYRADLMPYGGIKSSGIGREGPQYAVEEMTEMKSVVISLN